MKIYFIDKTGKNLIIEKAIARNGIEGIEIKKDIKFRINKLDIVITADVIEDFEGYSKIQKLIIITEEKSKKEIWKMATKLNTKDIIYMDMKNVKKMGERIAKKILN